MVESRPNPGSPPRLADARFPTAQPRATSVTSVVVAEEPGPMWAAILQHVAWASAIVVTILFLAAHQALDQIQPDENAARAELIVAGVLGIAALGAGIAGATRWKGLLALGIIGGTLLVPFLVAKGTTFGAAGCRSFNSFSVTYPCNPNAQIEGTVWLLTLLFVGAGGAIAGLLWYRRSTLAPGIALAVGGAMTLALSVASFILLSDLHHHAVEAAVANQPEYHRIPGLGLAMMVACLVGIAAVMRRRAR